MSGYTEIALLQYELEKLRQQLAEKDAEIDRLQGILVYELEYLLDNGNEVSNLANSYLNMERRNHD